MASFGATIRKNAMTGRVLGGRSSNSATAIRRLCNRKRCSSSAARSANGCRSSEGHRVIKVWRALWKKMAAMGFCDRDNDPSLIFANTAPDPRQHVWQRHEAYRLVQRAWRIGDRGLAALMAVVWDTMLSPGDARALTAGQMARDDHGVVFFLDRAKTGRAAAGTLTRWSEAILSAYRRQLGLDLLDDAPLFWTPGSKPGAKGGRRWRSQPYTKGLAEKHFRKVRAELCRRRRRAPARRHATIRRGRGNCRRRLPHRDFEQNGEHDRGLEPAAEDLHAGQRCLSAVLRRGPGAG